jgi:UDP-2-acetamido-3-amino-2,3-dideoxy-glucuronate N-acetyltransferase
MIRKGATIGANATIVCGNEIGTFSFIGAGAVVTKTVKSYALMVGTPAKQIGWMSEYGHKLQFNNNGEAVCSESGQKYLLSEGQIKRVA